MCEQSICWGRPQPGREGRGRGRRWRRRRQGPARLAVREVVVQADLQRGGGPRRGRVQEGPAVRLAAEAAVRRELVGGDADAVAAGLVLRRGGKGRGNELLASDVTRDAGRCRVS